jgi:hypothetical protein
MKNLTKKNIVAKELRTPKYRMRVVESDKVYNRRKEKKVDLD